MSDAPTPPLATPAPPSLPARWAPYVGTLGVFLGGGLATLNGRLITVGLPDLRGALGLGFDAAAWIPTAYNMALMFMGPFSVYLGASLGIRRVLLPAAAIFILCTLLLPFSPNLGVMLALQVISGLASGTFYPLTLSFALRALPPSLSIYAIAVYSVDILGATNLAVPLEAQFMEHLSWHWIFWFSGLVTPLMMLCIYWAIPHPPPQPGPEQPISWQGFLFAALGLSLIYGAIDQGERLDWLNSGVIVAMLVTAGFLIAATAIRRWIVPNPMVHLHFLLKRNVLIIGTSLFSFRLMILAVAILIPGYLGAIQGYRPLETGRVLIWVVIPQVVVGPLTAWVLKRFDARLVLAFGFSIVAAACLMNARLTSAWADVDFRTSQLVLGCGLSITFVSVIGCVLHQNIETGAIFHPVHLLTFSAYLQTVRLLGGEAGTGLMNRILAVHEQFHSNIIGQNVDLGNWVTGDRLTQLTGGLFPGSAGLDEAQARAASVLGQQVKAQATTLAYADAFTACAFVAAAAMILVAFMKPMQIGFALPSPPKQA